MKVSRARAPVQVLLHLVIALHLLLYYGLGWRAVGGTEPQGFFSDFLGEGLISAGVVLAAVAFIATLIFGRVFCGWGCHFGGFQDLSAWLLRKVVGEPRPVATRFLHLLPYALLLGVFVLPPVLRWTAGVGVPPGEPPPAFRLRVDLTNPPWAHLPGALVTVITFLACGTALLLFLGSRGFCRYVCPYGAAFRLLDLPAPFRVRRSASCSGCSERTGPAVAPCSAACPMGVRVHEEAQERGQVGDVDCIRCNLCVEACPRGALSMSFKSLELPVLAAPPLPAALSAPAARRWSFTLGEELLVAGVAVLSFLAWDLVHAAHFLAAAMALGEGFLALVFLRALRRPELAVLGVALKRGGRWTFAGAALPAAVLLTAASLAGSGSFKVLRWAGDRAYARAEALAASAEATPRRSPGMGERRALREAVSHYERALRFHTGDRITAYRHAAALAALGDHRAVELAEGLVRRDPGDLDAGELLRRVRARLGGPAPPSSRAP